MLLVLWRSDKGNISHRQSETASLRITWQGKKKEEGNEHKAERAIVSSDDVCRHIISPEPCCEQDWVTLLEEK